MAAGARPGARSSFRRPSAPRSEKRKISSGKRGVDAGELCVLIDLVSRFGTMAIPSRPHGQFRPANQRPMDASNVCRVSLKGFTLPPLPGSPRFTIACQSIISPLRPLLFLLGPGLFPFFFLCLASRRIALFAEFPLSLSLSLCSAPLYLARFDHVASVRYIAICFS